MKFDKKEINFDKIEGLDVKVTYSEINSEENKVLDSHTHDCCEIYLNISGEVAFEVEGLVYPVFPGSIIITRPNEHHHCIYRGNQVHKHYCIWFNGSEENEIFSMFFNRSLGTSNIFSLLGNSLFSLIENVEILKETNSKLTALSSFFNILDLISSNNENIVPYSSGLCEDVALAITYINENLQTNFTIKDVAKFVSVDISTLDRHFKSTFKITPSSYIKSKRLKFSKQLLENGKSVTDSCYESGFSDLSKFIYNFRKQFGITPKQYQLNLKK